MENVKILVSIHAWTVYPKVNAWNVWSAFTCSKKKWNALQSAPKEWERNLEFVNAATDFISTERVTLSVLIKLLLTIFPKLVNYARFQIAHHAQQKASAWVVNQISLFQRIRASAWDNNSKSMKSSAAPKD